MTGPEPEPNCEQEVCRGVACSSELLTQQEGGHQYINAWQLSLRTFIAPKQSGASLAVSLRDDGHAVLCV